MKSDMYVVNPASSRKRRRKRRRRNRVRQNIIRVAVIVAALVVLSAFVGAVFMLVNNIISKDSAKKKSVVQKVTLVNLDSGKEHTTVAGNQEENTTAATNPTETSTESTTTAIVEQTTKDPNVKDGFTQLTQVYREPTAEKFENDGFYDGTLFVGDSITTGISAYNGSESFNYNMPANVLADKGYTIGKIMLRKDEIVAYNPTRMFILVGSNDLNSSNPDIDSISKKYISAVQTLQEALPNTKIYIMLTLPINSKYEAKASIRNDKITEFDARLVELCNQNGIYYIDMATSLKGEDGMLIPELTEDGLHLKGKYYGFWYNIVKDTIKANEE